jgi:primosomal protein N' (replication factor Y)
MAFARVALPLPVATPYTYRIPEALADRVTAGARVVVPVRRQEMVGIVTEIGVASPDGEARDILAAPDAVAALTPPLVELGAWMTRYYGAPPGLTLRAMLPPGFWGHSTAVLTLRDPIASGGVAGTLMEWLEGRGGSAPIKSAERALRRSLWDVADRLVRVGALSIDIVPPDTGARAVSERVIAQQGEALTLMERDIRFSKRPRQRALYEAIEAGGGRMPWRRLVDQLGVSDTVLKSLLDAGLVRVEHADTIRDPFANLPSTPPPDRPNAAQEKALAALQALGPGEGMLLRGVTGSGKTLVYLEAIRATLEAGKGAILLVPEIGLTPQTVSRVRGAFGDQVAVLHSGLSDGERTDAWRLLRRGERRVAVGARSAIFAPIADLGLIVVDEEHDAGYKNGESPRYHGRDVAATRARLEGARLVLGSATPSLESISRTGRGLILAELSERVRARPMPPVTLVDLKSAPMIPGTGAVPWSELLDQAVSVALAEREQVLLLLNRRGFASFLQCRACGAVPECPNCSISLTIHHRPDALRCHYCDHRAQVPVACAECGDAVQVARGVGTQQLEQLMAERFPTARLARKDLDTTGARWAHHRIFEAVSRGDVDILLGTQMIAKGIDLPDVTLVGVVDADHALHLPDFRAAERTFQLLTQVAGRAGRGDRGGRVIVQTRQPLHHALVHATSHDVKGFLAEELALRQSPPYPPETSLVNVVVSGPDEAPVARRSMELADWCAAMDARHGLNLTVLGPAPCPVSRIKERYRYHVLLKGAGNSLGRIVRALAPRAGGSTVRLAIDRDPVSLL